MLLVAPASLFSTPFAAMATLAGAAAIPIVIHFLSRRRYQIVDWAAMRFLLAARRQNVRRLRIEQWLLLAIRAGLLMLMVAAMASVMPWAEAMWQRIMPGGALAAPVIAGRTHKVIVIDGSLSMTLRRDGGTCFDRAKDLASELIRSSAAGDGFSVVMLATPIQAVVAGPADDSRKVVNEIQPLRCTHGAADLTGALHLIEELIRKSPGTYAQREVYFFTDLQRSTWQPPGTPAGAWTESWNRLQAQSQLFVLDVGRPDSENLAVTNLSIADTPAIVGTTSTLTATIHNFGSKARKQAKVELASCRGSSGENNLQVVQQELVALPAGGSTPVSFPVQFPSAGEFVFQVHVEGDELEADDRRSLVVTAQETIPVLVVDGNNSPDRYQRAGSWLANALYPFTDSIRRPSYPARPKVIDTAKFADAGVSDLSPYDCVFLCDVPRLSEREISRLETHLQRGGGLVITLGPNVDLEAYNRLLFRDGRGLMPVKLLGIERAPGEGFFVPSASDDAYRRAPLMAFAGDDERASLLSARFKQYVRVEAAPGAAVRRILSLVPNLSNGAASDVSNSPRPGGDPCILEWPRHRGRVILFTSTLNTAWTSWPIAPSFPPLIQELFRFAVFQPPPRTVTVGEPLEALLPPSVEAADVIVQTPDKRSITVPMHAEANATQFQFSGADQSGLYQVILGGAKPPITFAVNVPSSGAIGGESDLRRLTPDELRALTPDEDVQISESVGGIRRYPKRTLDGSSEAVAVPDADLISANGPAVARWLLLGLVALFFVEAVLAWRFGSARAGRSQAVDQPMPSAVRKLTNLLLTSLAGLLLVICVVGLMLLIYAARSDDFLGFLPSAARQRIESALGVPAAGAGEGTRWRLEFMPFLTGQPSTDRWLVIAAGGLAILVGVLIYRRELTRLRNGWWIALPLIGLRSALVLLTLVMLLPQVRMVFERDGWPDLVLLIDDSQSMSQVDDYQDPAIKAKTAELQRVTALSTPQRLALAQALVTRSNAAWLNTLLERQARIHVFHCSSRVEKIAELDGNGDRETGINVVNSLRPTGPSSALGSAVRTVLQEFRGSTLAGIIMFTDGIANQGDGLIQSAQHAARAGVPLYFIGLGDALEPRDLLLHDLQVEDAVSVQDRLVFDVRLTAQGGLHARRVPVTLYERLGEQLKLLAREDVAIDPNGRPVRVKLMHTPASAGDREYVLDVPLQPDETDSSNNRLVRRVHVSEFTRTRVLYIEGYPRYEYRFLKTLLERESASNPALKTIDLKVLLTDADPDFSKVDRSAIDAMPATREELYKQFDLVILGDVDPKNPKLGEKHLQWLADFVREKGGGLLTIAGEQFMPHAYRDSPISDVLSVEVASSTAPEIRDRSESYRVQLTPAGRMHPIFRLTPDEVDNQAIWDRLTPVYWSATAFKPKPAAEVLAVRPAASQQAALPLVVQQFVGLGRSMYFGFDETWRWRLREDEGRYNQFWMQVVRFLARSRVGRTELRTDKQTPYRQSEPIRVIVRFPDDAPPPGADVPIQVMAEHVAENGEINSQTITLAKMQGSRASYEAIVTRTEVGQYKFWLQSPIKGAVKPQVTVRVLPPSGEMDLLRMNRVDMERAALVSRGRYYSLADADQLPAELPPLPRVPLNQPHPPWNVWNQPVIFALAVTLLGTEWLLRKRRQLL